jgi:uncharacterized protein (TIGR00297 family)
VTEPWILHVATGMVASAALGGVAYRAGSIDAKGLVAGSCVGTAVYAGAGWRGFLCLATFFVLGTLPTRVGRAAKGTHGARTVRHVLANGLVCASAAVVALVALQHAPVILAAFAGALAAATADTLSSEIGQVYGGRPYLLTELRPVPIGENGGVTLVGTLAGLGGATVLALVAVTLGVTTSVVPVMVGGVAGNAVDSVLGATLERSGRLSNAGVNLGCTLAGALVAGLLS